MYDMLDTMIYPSYHAALAAAKSFENAGWATLIYAVNRDNPKEYVLEVGETYLQEVN